MLLGWQFPRTGLSPSRMKKLLEPRTSTASTTTGGTREHAEESDNGPH
jgi:hypothetical protein